MDGHPDKLRYFFNEAWLVYTGHNVDQEMGNGWVAGVHPDDMAKYMEIHDNAFNSRKNTSWNTASKGMTENIGGYLPGVCLGSMPKGFSKVL